MQKPNTAILPPRATMNSRLERTFDAPLELVWRLWESRDHMIRWWGPESFTCRRARMELAPGTPWRATMAPSKEYRVSRMSGVIPHESKSTSASSSVRAWDNDSGPVTWKP